MINLAHIKVNCKWRTTRLLDHC